jgi:hypothetical protein
VPSLTPRDLALIFCNMRTLHEISSELVLAVAETLRDLPRINLSRCLAIYAVFFPALCRYMCNFPQVCIFDFFSFSPFARCAVTCANSPRCTLLSLLHIILIRIHDYYTHYNCAVPPYISNLPSIRNFPQAMDALVRARHDKLSHDWFSLVEEQALRAPLPTALMAPVEAIDARVSYLTALRDAAKIFPPADPLLVELQAAVKRGIEIIGQLRYRKRDCHSLLRLGHNSQKSTLN